MSDKVTNKVVTKKIDTIWFENILAGRKKFELRLADFDIAEGDMGDGAERKFTGRHIEKKVAYMQKIDLKDWAANQPEILDKGIYALQFE